MNDKYIVDTKCPFYRKHSQAGTTHTITCEGPGSNVILDYPSEDRKEAHMDKFCCMEWRRCWVAAVMLKYHERRGTEARKRIAKVTVRMTEQGNGQIRMF
jgi:hypothetical protein